MHYAVGMSGGVDSAVTALLLKSQGHTVVGVSMSIWGDVPPLPGGKKSCYAPDRDKSHVKALCDDIGIPFVQIDCTQAYREVVLKNFKEVYLSGGTPNPCVLCNSQIKLGLFPEWVRRHGIDFDYFATGHYACVIEQGGKTELHKATDTQKDQSYFLYRLTLNQLRFLRFPLGDFTKPQVRQMARQYDLSVSETPDSQDFYAGDYADLIGVPDRPGPFMDMQGHILGTHKGFWHYTLGQRKGLNIALGFPAYVVDIRPQDNTVVLGGREDMLCTEMTVLQMNWLADMPQEFDADVKMRSTQTPIAAHIERTDVGIKVLFQTPVPKVPIGQSLVMYQGTRVIGGGFIA